MNAQFYIEKVVKYGNKKVQKLYHNLDHPLTNVEMRLISRLVGISEALEHEYEDYFGFSEEYWNINRDYKSVNRLLARVCKATNKARKASQEADYHQFDQYL